MVFHASTKGRVKQFGAKSELILDYEQSLCFLIVRRERSEKNRPRESWCLGGRRKKKGLQTKPQRLTYALLPQRKNAIG